MAPKELELLASHDASIVDYLRRRYGSLSLAWARGYLLPEELRQIASMGDADFDALLDGELARGCPEQAAVLMRHRAWYRNQLRAVQAALLGREAPHGGSGPPVASGRR